jgi:HK97 family phage major capsid protein
MTEQEKLEALLAKTAKEAGEAATKAANEALDKRMAGTVDTSIGETIMGKTVSGTSATSGQQVVTWQPDTVPKGITAARWIKTLALGNGNMVIGESKAKSMYPHDKFLAHNYVEQKALSATIPDAGGFTVPQVLASEIIMPLYTLIGVTKLGGRRVPLVNGNMTIPRINTATTVGWIGENAPAGVSQEVIGDTKLNVKKLGVITPVSNDLLRSADIAADQWVLDDIRNQMYVEMDRAMLYGTNTSFTPGGLNALLPAAQIQGSTSTALTTTLITQLYGALRQANVQFISPGIIMNATMESYLMNLVTSTGAFLFYAEMVERGTVRGIPYAVSNNCTFTDTGTYSTSSVQFWIGDWSEFIVGTQGDLMVETSRDGSYESGGTTYSALSRDQTIIRVLSLQDYAVRHTASFIGYTAKLATS